MPIEAAVKVSLFYFKFNVFLIVFKNLKKKEIVYNAITVRFCVKHSVCSTMDVLNCFLFIFIFLAESQVSRVFLAFP